MKYFTQYLPVEGEINPYDIEIGESFFDHSITNDGIGTRLEGGWFSCKNQDKVNFPLSEKVQRVRIFLCSKDIQVGDKYQYFNMGKIWNDVATQEIISLLRNPAPPFKPFKVLGEKSSAATWVTADMEFEESDIKRTANIGEFDTEIDPYAIAVLFRNPETNTFQ